MLIRFTVCSLCILTYCNFSCFPFWFEGGTLVLIAFHCFSSNSVAKQFVFKEFMHGVSKAFFFRNPI